MSAGNSARPPTARQRSNASVVRGFAHRRPTTTRSCPARSRSRWTDSNPGVGHQRWPRRQPGRSRSRARPAGPCRRRRRAGGSRRDRPARRTAPRPARSGRPPAAELRPRRRTAGSPARRRTRAPPIRSASRSSTSSPSRSAFASATASVRRLMSVPQTSRSDRSSFSASATAPLPVPTSTTRAPREGVKPTSTSSSVSGRGIRTRGVTTSVIRRNWPCGRGCRRSARAPRGAPASSSKRRQRVGRSSARRAVDHQPRAVDAEHRGQQQLRVQPRGLASGRGQRCRGTPPNRHGPSPRARPRQRALRQSPAPPGVGASRRPGARRSARRARRAGSRRGCARAG